MSNPQKKNVPELRFPGFEGEWEEKKLEGIIKVNSGKDYKHLDKGDIPVYGTGGFMTSVSEPLSEIDAVGIGRKGTINKPYLLEAPFWTVDTLFYCTPKKETDILFILSLFRKINWKVYDESTGVPSLSKQTINKINRFVPTNKEQQKIGKFFSKLDRQIELEEQKLELLQQQKKGYMQKIFSQELRFKDENGEDYPDWENKQLGELGVTYAGLSGKAKEDFGFGKDVYVSYVNVFKNNIATLEMVGNVSIKPGEKQNNVKFGDILFTTSSEIPHEVGMSSVWLYEKDNVYLNSFCFGFRTTVSFINPIFLARYLRSFEMRKLITILAQGSTRFNISKKELMKLIVKIPRLDEQNRIINLFSILDGGIELQSMKVRKLKKRKQGLLQKMFI
ncbi:TPA: restriction endonuclease subunit S [Staphylococcus aureus]|nr:restriction endonuclease subunit S [Staphylococcus aureus]HDJ2897215.1 restriction endonuclease subunit S [Staphylococcus aureus]HDJ2898580.1 restriction endonuclease subunit S [Staphylococcus aureus]HDJ2901057.1 restriction endonuclease subunit S [Staphylococcus aureus]HDJ3130828.1 restriction endonuclease subunit S [Staphylococcus aureus]